MLETVQRPEFRTPIDPLGPIYLLLESEALEDYLRARPGAADQPSAHAEVRDIDYCTFARWVWSGTEYEPYAARGPLLVRCEGRSPLLDVFRNEWAAHDVGLMIRTPAGMDEVLTHLRGILFVELAGDGPARFRLQEPLALASVLRALAPQRAAALLGPLQELVWRENNGPTHQWWRHSQDEAEGASTGFVFTPAELAAIDAGLAERFEQTQVALTEQATHQTYENARLQVLLWMDQLKGWGYLSQGELAAALDVLRHPRFAAESNRLLSVLQDTGQSVAARLTTAQHHLDMQGA